MASSTAGGSRGRETDRTDTEDAMRISGRWTHTSHIVLRREDVMCRGIQTVAIFAGMV